MLKGIKTLRARRIRTSVALWSDLAELCFCQQRCDEAEILYEQCYKIWKNVLKDECLEICQIRNKLN